MKHKPGKSYKFLEIPANAHRDKFVTNVKARIADYSEAVEVMILLKR
jgi:hypothetical protein